MQDMAPIMAILVRDIPVANCPHKSSVQARSAHQGWRRIIYPLWLSKFCLFRHEVESMAIIL